MFENYHCKQTDTLSVDQNQVTLDIDVVGYQTEILTCTHHLRVFSASDISRVLSPNRKC